MSAATAGALRRTRDTALMLGLIWLVWYAAWSQAGDSAITSPGRTVAYAFDLLGSANFWGHAKATLTAIGKGTTW